MQKKSPRKTRPPAYRQRKGSTKALVTLRDAVTKRARDYWLGEYGSPESRELYHRTIAAWEARGRRWPDVDLVHGRPTQQGRLTIIEVINQYWGWAESYYSPSHLGVLKPVLRLLRKLYGMSPAADFGPNKLRALRDEMLRGDEASDPPREPWSRNGINKATLRIRHVFKWAVARELVPPGVHQALCTLDPLKRGRTSARENPKVAPAPLHLVERAMKQMSKPIRALVELQLLTGARPGELLHLRPADLEMDRRAGIWTYRPESHKNAYREHDRVIYFGPRAQEVLQPFLSDRSTTAYLFSPRDAEAARREALSEKRTTPLSCGNRPGTNRSLAPSRQPGECYTTASYRRAITRACDVAFPPTPPLRQRQNETKKEWRRRLTTKQKAELRDWQREHRWHPHQLRHNAATHLRREFGLEAAQLALGHASAAITDAVYAERDQARVIDIMRRIG